MRSSLFALCISLAAPAVGCQAGDSVPEVAESAQNFVRADLTYTRADSGLRFDAQAQFVRYRSFAAGNIRTILGVADFESLAPDSCRVVDSANELDDALAARENDGALQVPEVTLLDAGRVEVRGPSGQTLLNAYHYPELVPFVSGVVYGAEDAAPSSLAPGREYSLHSDGGEEVGPFAANVHAPVEFPALNRDALLVSSAGDLGVRWSGRSLAEPMLLEVRYGSSAGAKVVRCRAADDGQFDVPSAYVTGIGSGATVSLARVERSPILAPGIGEGQVSFALREQVSLP